jgi:glyoxylase-like metal-dependent hydrolase (beta-lactamase superfamily II)
LIHQLGDGLAVWVRGWLHGNVVIDQGGDRTTVIDTGYHTGAEALFEALGEAPVSAVLLTHTHSDHAGCVGALVRRYGCPVHAHPEVAAITEPWNPVALWLEHTGQILPRFRVDQVLEPGRRTGRWQVLEAGGHATGGVALLDEMSGVLLTGDALWEDGFGVLDPWIDGACVFDQARSALEQLGGLDDRLRVVPGHGSPFLGLHAAVDRALGRLAYLEARPDRLVAQLSRNFLGFARLTDPNTPHPPDLQACLVADRTGPPPPGPVWRPSLPDGDSRTT